MSPSHAAAMQAITAAEANEPMRPVSEQQRMAAEEAVMACYEVSGEFDFLLIVSAESMEQYHAFTREAFSSNHNVRNFKSMFAMNCSKFETRVPLRAAAAD